MHDHLDLLPDRIKTKLAVDPETDCWLWAGKWTTGNGYGKLSWMGHDRVAHRVVYELLIGPVPEHFHLDHLCKRRACCNPEHLEPVTPRENTLRGAAQLFTRASCG